MVKICHPDLRQPSFVAVSKMTAHEKPTKYSATILAELEKRIKLYQLVVTQIACLQIIKMYRTVESYKSNLCSGVARQLIQTRPDRLCHNLHKNVRGKHKFKLCTRTNSLFITNAKTQTTQRPNIFSIKKA
jgi:hypothetical protein